MNIQQMPVEALRKAPSFPIKRNWIKIVLMVILFSIFVEVSWLSYNILNDDRALRVRNALLAITTEYNNTDWSPHRFPEGFRLEKDTPPPLFKEIVLKIITDPDQNNLEKAVKLVQHLHETAGSGTPIKRDTLAAYYEIVVQGFGYCSDYTQVFLSLAYTASVPVREWGFSTDNYGGGHAFVEIWEPVFNKWVFIDPFVGFMVIDKKSGAPLSVIEFNHILLQNKKEQVDIVRISESMFQLRDSEEVIAFYQSGAKEFYLWWGNDIFTYEKSRIISFAGKMSRSMEEFVAILMGEFPKIMILRNNQNNGAIKNLLVTRYTAMIILCSLPIFTLLAGLLFLIILKERKRSIAGAARADWN